MNKPRGKLAFDPSKTMSPAAIAAETPAKPARAKQSNTQTIQHSNNETPPPPPAKPGRKGQGAASREGTQFVAAHVPIEAALQLKSLALQQRSSLQVVLTEAINDLFQKHGLNRIA